MPAGDGTGPMGTGPMTGRGAGYCAGYTMPGFMNPMPGQGMSLGRGMGFGRGRGGGRHGWRHQFYATGLPLWARAAVPDVVPLGPNPAPADEVQALKNQAGLLEQTLEQLKLRIGELEQPQAKENR